MTTNPVPEVPDAVFEIRAIRSDLQEHFVKSGALLDRANAALYLNLGRIYEAAQRIVSDSALEKALIDEVNAIPEVIALPSWDAEDKSIFENLLVLAVGYEDKESVRSRYLAALMNAAYAKVSHDKESFAAWVKKQHGLINAASGRTEAPARPLLEVIVDFSMDPANNKPDAPHLDFEPPVNANSANYAVALLRKDPGGGSKVIGTLNDQKIVATMITALLPKKARPMTPSRMRKAEAKAIWHLNRFLHKELKLERGKPKNNDLALFKKAIDSLKEIPELRAKYFEGETGFSAEVDSLKKIYRLKVQNPDFHVLDPGRYIKGAKEGALVPYEFDRSLAFNYDERQRDFPGLIGYLNSVPRRRKQESPSSTAGDVTKLAGEPAKAEEDKIDATPKKELTEA